MSQRTINLLVLVVIAVFAWIGVELYFSFKQDRNSQLDKELNPEIIAPLETKFNSSVVKTLQQRNAKYKELEQTPLPTASPTTSPTPTPRTRR